MPLSKSAKTNSVCVLSATGILRCLLLAFILLSCGGGGGDGSSTADNPDGNTPTGGTVSLGAFNSLGLVTDTSGQPVNFAVISDASGVSTQTTSSGGAFFGEMAGATGDWVKVSADGYADTYTNSLGEANGARIFETRLTPLGDSVEFVPGTAGALSHGNLSVQLPAGLFASGATVAVTDIAPQDMDASYAPLSNGIFHPFLRTFSITATDADGDPALFADGQTMAVTITLPSAVTTVPLLAYFDATTGKWQELADSCNLVDPTTMSCDLPHLSVLGVGGDAANAGGTPSMPYPNPATRAEAKANIRYGMAVKAEGINSGDEVMEADGQEIMTIGAAQYVDLARQYAAGHDKDETGKFALIDAAAVHAMINGHDGTFDELMSEAATIADNIGKELLKEPGCGNVLEMMQSMAQIYSLNGSMAVYDDLETRVQEAIDTCDPWIGKIYVTYTLADELPLVPDFHKQGGGPWTEVHKVWLFSDPSTAQGDPPVYTLSGHAVVDVSMAETTYRTELPSGGSCPVGWNDYRLSATPESAEISLAIEGKYSPEGTGFDITAVQRAVLTGGDVDLTWTSMVHTYIITNSQCSLAEFEEGPTPYVTGYLSFIGDTSIQPAPPITLEEMLNTGYKRSSEVTESIYGMKTFPLSIPEITLPWSAVTSVKVTWDFTHIKQPQ